MDPAELWPRLAGIHRAIRRGMRARWLLTVSFVVVSLPVVARAEGPVDPVMPPAIAPAPLEQPRPLTYRPREVPSAPMRPVAFGLNNPIGWYRGAIGASLYVGLSQHLAIRANFSRYGHYEMLEDVASAVGGGDGVSYRGRVIDYGVGLVHYSTRRWEGFMLEAGVLLRDRAIRDRDFFEERVVKNWTLTYAARGMIGWSWRIGPAFVAAAVGLSAGHEWGREAVTPETFPPMPTVTSRVSRRQVDGEAYLRIGLALGD